MAQRIIIVHGRGAQPAKAKLALLQRRAFLQGLERIDPAKADKVATGQVEIDYVYFGDVNNSIIAQASQSQGNTLTARDPHADNAPCLPDTGYAEAIDKLSAITRFDEKTYRRILSKNDDLRLLDDVVRAFSTFAEMTTAAALNEWLIKVSATDMGAYLLRRTVGSQIRERLQSPLKRALKRGDDICLISHSMGCMVAYDVLWKFSRMSEYRDVRRNGNRVSRWITLGSLLGEAGVKANLYDASEHAHEDGTDKHPFRIVKDWHNIAAEDDFIGHDPTMRDDFSDMLKFGYVETIQDTQIYNCFVKDGRSNPHKLYGFLVHPTTADVIARWIE